MPWYCYQGLEVMGQFKNMDAAKLIKGYDMGKMFVDRHHFAGKTALDIGAGHCAHTLAFAEKFDRVDAIDIIDDVQWTDLKTISSKAEKVNFFLQDAHLINHLHDKYDLIYSLSAFEHFEDWKKVMNHIPNLLNPGGKFYLVISPLYYSQYGHHLDPEMKEWEHILFPEKELKEQFKKRGGVDWKWQLYTELNKATAAELIEEAQKLFKISYLKADITSIEMICDQK